MDLKQPKTFQSKDYELARLQTNFQEFARQLSLNQFLIGNLLDISLTASGLSVNHGLQKTPNGWIVLDIDTNATVWRTAWDDKTISLDASATVAIKVWVF